MQLLIYLAITVAVSLLSVAMMPKPQSQSPDPARSLDLPQVEEGTAQCVIFGDCWSGDWMVLGHGNYRTEEIRRG
jgi:hypothetical protein